MFANLHQAILNEWKKTLLKYCNALLIIAGEEFKLLLTVEVDTPLLEWTIMQIVSLEMMLIFRLSYFTQVKFHYSKLTY